MAHYDEMRKTSKFDMDFKTRNYAKKFQPNFKYGRINLLKTPIYE